jgi:hypothetical protein
MWDDLFLPHPRTVNESYFEHAGFAGRFAATLFLAAHCALVHAVFPAIFNKLPVRWLLNSMPRLPGGGVMCRCAAYIGEPLFSG